MQNGLKQRMPLVILVGVIVVLSCWDWIFGLEHWMAVPREAMAALEAVRAGEFSAEIFGELMTILGSNFLHGGLAHLLGNMLFFWIFGAVILELCGWRWLLLIFLTTAIGASMGQILLNREGIIPFLGASGIVTGFEGAYLGLIVRKPRPDPHVWPMAHAIPPAHLAAIGVIGVVIDLRGIYGNIPAGIAYGAHVGGFVTGILVSLIRRD